MKHHLPNLIIPVFLILMMISCESKRKSIDTTGNISPKVQKEVTIYGSENCEHCVAFRKAMDESKFTYEFKDAEASERIYHELLMKT